MPDATPGGGGAPDQPTPLAEADLTPPELAFLTTHSGVPTPTNAQLAALRERSAAREASVTAGSLSLEQAAAHTGRTADEIRADIEAGRLLAYAPGATDQPLLLRPGSSPRTAERCRICPRSSRPSAARRRVPCSPS